MDGPHSPFGSIWQIASATGWSIHYILWRVDYLTLRLMLLDQPRYISADEQKEKINADGRAAGADDGSDIAAQFEAELKRYKRK
ncbi:MAG: hypothetical protein LBV18_04055 [Alistipes sp.]|jgi:hypothetical protein|nr:hypothetical protein [Alistipes sp.]